ILEESSGRFRSSPLYRTVFLLPLESARNLGDALGEARRFVECVGAAPFPDEEIAAAVSACGIPNLVAIGRMQRPSLDWRQGGKDPLEGIVVERTVNRS
ncbi:MAG: hypothetical protein ACREQY_21100, partial [Candidatus Binatia bacterium]